MVAWVCAYAKKKNFCCKDLLSTIGCSLVLKSTKNGHRVCHAQAVLMLTRD